MARVATTITEVRKKKRTVKTKITIMAMMTNLETKKIKIKVLRIETKPIVRLERITSNMKKIRLYLIDYHHDMTCRRELYLI